jgi:tetratricopeptide (TPR) repeat protein
MLLWGVACAAAPPAEPAPEPVAVEEPNPLLADAEADRVLANKYYELARRQRERSELSLAQESIRRALALRPDDPEYRALELAIGVDMAERPATVALIAQEAAAREAVRREEELLTVRRLLTDAARAEERQDWEGARRAYERALFVLRTSRFREEDEYRAVFEPATRGLEGIPDARAEAERRQREENEKSLAR